MPINLGIDANEVRVVADDGQLGVMSLRDAVRAAEERGLDLVLMSPNAHPPVCKIMDYGKYKYEQSKKANLAKKRQHVIQVKEVKVSSSTDQHDLEVKIKRIRKFLEEGNKVKLSLRFRGREMAYTGRGADQLKGIASQVEDLGKVEKMPDLEGRQMIMIIAPMKK
ncbi:MAG TPA: translation initiation factor IF-3 [Mariprofundaceae bacterium]|nr:translation initiation factor IF-3 [Mariprofundaceae bacterium]